MAAAHPIDCPRADRIKIHPLFASNSLEKYLNPTYEDTFDSIEEFILDSLFTEWKSFIEEEEKYFSHVRIYVFFYLLTSYYYIIHYMIQI